LCIQIFYRHGLKTCSRKDIQTYRYTHTSYRFRYLNYTIAGAPGDDDEKGAALVFKYANGR
jgi:hypothetical protein